MRRIAAGDPNQPHDVAAPPGNNRHHDHNRPHGYDFPRDYEATGPDDHDPGT